MDRGQATGSARCETDPVRFTDWRTVSPSIAILQMRCPRISIQQSQSASPQQTRRKRSRIITNCWNNGPHQTSEFEKLSVPQPIPHPHPHHPRSTLETFDRQHYPFWPLPRICENRIELMDRPPTERQEEKKTQCSASQASSTPPPQNLTSPLPHSSTPGNSLCSTKCTLHVRAARRHRVGGKAKGVRLKWSKFNLYTVLDLLDLPRQVRRFRVLR